MNSIIKNIFLKLLLTTLKYQIVYINTIRNFIAMHFVAENCENGKLNFIMLPALHQHTDTLEGSMLMIN
jgi:hypothetical protein